MKYNLCKNSISLISQKSGTASRQIKTTAAKTVGAKTKDSSSQPPKVQNVEKNSSEEDKAEEDKDEMEEVDVGRESPVKTDNKNATKPNVIVHSENTESNETKSLPRPSAFSPVTPTRDVSEKSPAPQSDEPKTSTLHQPSFPWGTISPSIPLKPPYPPPMVPEYPSYLLTDRALYPPYYLTANHQRSDPNAPSSFRREFLDPQRPVVPQPVAPVYPPLYPPYPYRYCHSLHPSPPLHYSLYSRPHELSITGPRYLPLDLYAPNIGPNDFYMQGRTSHSTSATEEIRTQGQSNDKATRLSPKEGCSASGSPDRPSNTHNIQSDTEGSQYTTVGGQASKLLQPSSPDSRHESSAEILLQLRRQHLEAGSAGQYPSPSEHYAQATSDNREDVAPLNLSTRSQEREMESPHRLDAEHSNKDELPLNLSLRPNLFSPSTWSTSETPQPEQDLEMEEEEEGCDQRQTAALALCQLASVSSATSSCDITLTVETAIEEPLETNQEFIEETKYTKEATAKSVKRKNKSENNCHKSNKRTKTTGRALRRRPRCC